MKYFVWIVVAGVAAYAIDYLPAYHWTQTDWLTLIVLLLLFEKRSVPNA